MAKTPTFDPMTSDVRSSLIAGLTEACNKISSTLDLKTETMENLPMPELFIASNDRCRIYQAPVGNKLWMAVPAPVIKKNGIIISPNTDYFTIDYLGGSIAFDENHRLQESDVVTVSATYIVDKSNRLDTLVELVNSLSEKSGKNKGSFESYNDLYAAYPTASAGDFAIVTNEDAVYVWSVNESDWVNSDKTVDLSAYYTKGQTDTLLSQKEASIAPKGTSVSDDNYYYGGRKTWVDFFFKVRNCVLSDIVFNDASNVTAADTVLLAIGKLQAQIDNLIHPLTATNAPTTSTVGRIGQDYIDTSNGDKYHLVRIENADTTPSYVWEQYSDISAMKSYVDDSIKVAILDSWEALY